MPTPSAIYPARKKGAQKEGEFASPISFTLENKGGKEGKKKKNHGKKSGRNPGSILTTPVLLRKKEKKGRDKMVGRKEELGHYPSHGPPGGKKNGNERLGRSLLWGREGGRGK